MLSVDNLSWNIATVQFILYSFVYKESLKHKDFSFEQLVTIDQAKKQGSAWLQKTKNH